MTSQHQSSAIGAIAIGIDDAAKAVGVHKATFRRQLIDTGLVTPRKIGHRTVYLLAEVQEAVSELPTVDPKAA
ncbi:MAG: helix-turn-helix domain-containing protein [Gammaproteobacteria bacterium]|nr:helix-turn-helix domain-containing protein [Gammaproteobacteria bacterium]